MSGSCFRYPAKIPGTRLTSDVLHATLRIFIDGKTTPSPSLIRDPPALEPLEMPPLRARSLHTKRDSPEEPEEPNDGNVQSAIQHPADLLVQLAGRKVDAEAGSQDSEVQSGVVVVDVGNTTHGDEGEVVQEPANDRVETGVVNLVNFSRLEVLVSALPADEVEGNQEGEDTKGCSGAPVDDGVAEKKVLDDYAELADTHATT